MPCMPPLLHSRTKEFLSSVSVSALPTTLPVSAAAAAASGGTRGRVRRDGVCGDGVCRLWGGVRPALPAVPV